MYRICKQFTFEAAHQLTSLPADHKCSRLHGHSYSVEITLTATELDEHGFIVDFAELEQLGRYLKSFDHQFVNDVVEGPPTCEYLAGHIFAWSSTELHLPERVTVEAVRVSETATTWAEYSP